MSRGGFRPGAGRPRLSDEEKARRAELRKAGLMPPGRVLRKVQPAADLLGTAPTEVAKATALSLAVNNPVRLVEEIDGELWTTSLLVAEKFGKRHDDVLKAIRGLECSSDFNARNFAGVEYQDAKGEVRPFYRMTQWGFARLAFGFTGSAAAAWKERFIEAFRGAMDQLRSNAATFGQLVDELRRTNERLVALESSLTPVPGAVERIDRTVVLVDAKVTSIEKRMPKRKEASPAVKRAHFAYKDGVLRGLCMCCVTHPPEQTRWELDHFFDNGRREFEAMWLICKPCHDGLTHGRIKRQEVRSRFDAYQERAREFNPQPDMFGGFKWGAT